MERIWSKECTGPTCLLCHSENGEPLGGGQESKLYVVEIEHYAISFEA